MSTPRSSLLLMLRSALLLASTAAVSSARASEPAHTTVAAPGFARAAAVEPLYCTVTRIPLGWLVAQADVIAVARVHAVTGAPGEEFATASVEELWKGAPRDTLRFRAHPVGPGSARGCDLSDAELGERALLFLTVADQSTGELKLTHAGRGRMTQLADGCEPSVSLLVSGIDVPGLTLPRRNAEGELVTTGVPYSVMAALVADILQRHSEAGRAALREELLAMHAEALSTRGERAPAIVRHAVAAPGNDTDPRHIARLREIVDTHGWPSRSLVGDDAARAAFEFALNAGSDHALQPRMVWAMSEAARRGHPATAEAAHLEDRWSVTFDAAQTYGTQYTLESDANGAVRYVLPEVWGIDELDQRRAEVGLAPWAETERALAAAQGREPAARPRTAAD